MCDNEFTEIEKCQKIKEKTKSFKKAVKELFGKKTCFSPLLTPTKLVGQCKGEETQRSSVYLH